MASITAVELGADTCALANASVRSGGIVHVSTAEVLDPAAFPGGSFGMALRQMRRRLKLPRRCRVVLWGVADGASRRDAAVRPLLAPLEAAGFRIERVVSPCNALAALARLKTSRGENATCWLAINRRGVAIVVVRPGRQIYSHSFLWDSTIGATGSQARLLQRYSLVSHLSPEVKRAMAAARQHGTPVDAIVTCGNLPDLRSMTMPLIEELDVEVETLDSLDGLEVKKEDVDRLADIAPAIRLACAGVATRSSRPWDQSRKWKVRAERWLLRAAVIGGMAAVGYAWYARSHAPAPAASVPFVPAKTPSPAAKPPGSATAPTAAAKPAVSATTATAATKPPVGATTATSAAKSPAPAPTQPPVTGAAQPPAFVPPAAVASTPAKSPSPAAKPPVSAPAPTTAAKPPVSSPTPTVVAKPPVSPPAPTAAAKPPAQVPAHPPVAAAAQPTAPRNEPRPSTPDPRTASTSTKPPAPAPTQPAVQPRNEPRPPPSDSGSATTVAKSPAPVRTLPPAPAQAPAKPRNEPRSSVNDPRPRPAVNTPAVPADKPVAASPTEPAPTRRPESNSTRLPPRLPDPMPRITSILVSGDRRYATVEGGQIVEIGDILGRRTVIAIDERAVVLREPSGIQIRLGLGGRVLGVGPGGV